MLADSLERGRVQDTLRSRLRLERLELDDEAIARVEELTGEAIGAARPGWEPKVPRARVPPSSSASETWCRTQPLWRAPVKLLPDSGPEATVRRHANRIFTTYAGAAR